MTGPWLVRDWSVTLCRLIRAGNVIPRDDVVNAALTGNAPKYFLWKPAAMLHLSTGRSSDYSDYSDDSAVMLWKFLLSRIKCPYFTEADFSLPLQEEEEKSCPQTAGPAACLPKNFISEAKSLILFPMESFLW